MNILNHPTATMRQKIKQRCAPLFDRFDITGFCYDMSFIDGEASMLTDNIELFETYYSGDFNPVCSNASGRILAPGIYTAKMLYEKNEDKAPFAYLESLYKTPLGIHIVEHLDGYDEMVTFLFSLSSNDFDFFILNHQIQLKNFVRYFREALHAEIAEVSKKENRLYFPELLEVDTHQICLDRREDTKSLHLILEDGKEVIIPPQQAACLKLLISGKAIKQIASALFLSTRTVEHYLASARTKLSCRSILTLITKYGDQVSRSSPTQGALYSST